MKDRVLGGLHHRGVEEGIYIYTQLKLVARSGGEQPVAACGGERANNFLRPPGLRSKN